MGKLNVMALAAVGAFFAIPAQGATWNVAFTGSGGVNTDTAAFKLVTSDTLNGAGGYNIIGAAGQVDGLAITGLIAPGTAGSFFVSTNGLWNLDNVLFESAPFMSNNGWGFTLAGGSEVNIWATSPNSHAVANGLPGSGNSIQFARGTVYGSVFSGRVTVSAVPEFATWAMMLGGFGMVGSAMRARRKSEVSFG